SGLPERHDLDLGTGAEGLGVGGRGVHDLLGGRPPATDAGATGVGGRGGLAVGDHGRGGLLDIGRLVLLDGALPPDGPWCGGRCVAHGVVLLSSQWLLVSSSICWNMVSTRLAKRSVGGAPRSRMTFSSAAIRRIPRI